MPYHSTTVCTKNDAGDWEVEIVYENGFIRDLLGKPRRKEVYVGKGGTVWFEKGEAHRADAGKERKICDVVEWHRQQEVYFKRN